MRHYEERGGRCPHNADAEACPYLCHMWPDWWADLALRLIRLTELGELAVTDLTALQSAVAQNTTDIETAITALNDLSAKASTGGTVEQADIDAITAQLTSAHTSLSAAVTADDPVTPPVSNVPEPAPVPVAVEPVPGTDPTPTPVTGAAPDGGDVIEPADGAGVPAEPTDTVTT